MNQMFVRRLRLVVALSALALLTACAAAGVMTTTDPAKKLTDALDLFDHLDRPLPAERFIIEARDAYLASGDRVGLAESYRIYALFLRSVAVGEFADHYRSSGFMDASITYEKRYSGALTYLSRAEHLYLEAHRSDMLSNIYFHMAMVSQLNGNLADACAFLDRSVRANADYSAGHPAAPVEVPQGYSSFREAIDARKKTISCP